MRAVKPEIVLKIEDTGGLLSYLIGDAKKSDCIPVDADRVIGGKNKSINLVAEFSG